MLTWPKFNTPFEPTIFFWLGGISIFDREETLGSALWAYDPNEKSDREEVIRSFILSRFNSLTYRHRFLLVEILKSHLLSRDFDFSSLFESDDDANIYMAWDETEIDDPRGFFEDIYRLASDEWGADILRASAEDQSTW
jgi:hypothetical protein